MSKVTQLVCCVILAAFLCLAAGCHTVKGAGEDMEQGGKDIQKSADKNM
jgi:predicted small secreted protein